ncbi:glycosyltransferase family 2 protein [Gloeobacter kilaueensis]|uniref:Glycosyl transferase family 2 n=1 Tax=Gloeobacter kilaueensis (strain ATCC BAA-2537 / CCAP 1431/1 / ULC 316 / JS1) TaxID=1183438 RepID=U5QJS8_GLOK1|nr:glycosyltransferase family 2 protein [Gloeobacter kilaueensis]AGY57844.1 glycosyl transferase family 2 [Gloeobacter kilaueensis JS1]
MSSVSIVTPVYKAAKFLPEFLFGISKITSVDIEHIVVDGKSDDGSVDILQQYSKLYNLKWISEKDTGQYNAINKGFSMATSDFVGYQNVDDFYFENGLATLIASLKGNPAFDGGYGRYVIVDEHKSFLATPYNQGSFFLNKLVRGNFVFPGTFFIRRSALDNIAFDEKLNFYGDWDWLLQIALAGKKITHLPVEVAAFRRCPGSKSLTWSQRRLSSERKYIGQKHNLNFNAMQFTEFRNRVAQRLTTEWKKLNGDYASEKQSYDLLLRAQ